MRTMATKVAEYGSWDSPITPELFSQGNCKAITEIQANQHGVFWVEQHIETGKRAVFQLDSQGVKKAWAEGYSVQNAVHEYGGGSLATHEDGSILFTTVQGLYRQKSVGEPVQQIIDSQEKTLRYADMSVAGKLVATVEEEHVKGGGDEHPDPENRVVLIDQETTEKTVLSEGADFYACPRLRGDGRAVAWMQWNHINMPWDETSIWLAEVDEAGKPQNARKILDGEGKNINYYNPAWLSDGRLVVVSDESGWWNVYEVDVQTGATHNMYPVSAEIGYPLWQFGDRPFAGHGDTMVFNVNGKLVVRKADLVQPLSTPDFTVFTHLRITPQLDCYAIAMGPKKASSLIRIRLAAEQPSVEVLRESRSSASLAALDGVVSEARSIEFLSDGVQVQGWYYAPKNGGYSGPEGALPPCILLGHGGPTGVAWNTLDIKKQFFTSRGFAVFDVNYRGSTSFGSAFRHSLKKNWGVVDRNDMINGATALIEQGLVDKSKVCIMGSSAGGYLVLSALLHSNVFSAAVSIYGVADLDGLAKDTHKFERGYNESLIGKYPDERELYDERSPIKHVDKLRTPIAFLHGLEDTVVPPAQSVDMFKKLSAAGVTTGLLMWENEGHGFRGATAIRESNEASYYFLCKALGIEPSVQSKLAIVNLPSNKI